MAASNSNPDPNPYATPGSPVSDPPSPADGKRPKLVWAIFLFSLFGVVAGTLTTLLIATGQFPAASEAHEQYMDSIPLYQHGLSLASITLYLAAAIQLFRLKAAAFTLYALHLGLTVAVFLLQISNPAYRAVMATGYTALLVGWGIALAIVLYCWRLKRQGRLR